MNKDGKLDVVVATMNALVYVLGGDGKPLPTFNGGNPVIVQDPSLTDSSDPQQIRDRIVDFRRVKGKDLLSNPNNWRMHSEEQRGVLRDLLGDIGIANALIARQTQSGKLEIIDGHLRQDTNPNIEWPVLVLDVTEEEATKLLLSLDPLAGMATGNLDRLR